MNRRQPRSGPSRAARMIWRHSVLVILAWLALAFVAGLGVPTLEGLEEQHSVLSRPADAPSMRAAKRVDQDFRESDSHGVAMIVVEGQQPLGNDAHQYYDRLVRQLAGDARHVRHIQNFWGDPLMVGAAQSVDGQAAYVQLNLAGRPGQRLGNESLDAVRRIVERTAAPPGVQAYVTGPAASAAGIGQRGDRAIVAITIASIAAVFMTLLLAYRSLAVAIVLLLTVGIAVQVAAGLVAFLGQHRLVDLGSAYTVTLLVAVGIAVAASCGIVFVGRYQEARRAGEDRQTAYDTAYRGVVKVTLACGLTIAAAFFCFSFTRLPLFQTLGVPGAVGVTATVTVAVTLVPAVLAVGARFGLFDPTGKARAHRWRRVGAAVVRWPGPILVATLAAGTVGVLALPGYTTSYNDQQYLPNDAVGNSGRAAAGRHFPASRMMMPDVLLVEADHDLRNPADLLILNKLAKAVLAVPGISGVQSLTRPEGTPIEHTSIPFMLSAQGVAELQTVPFQKNRINDLLVQADELADTINVMQRTYGLMRQLVRTTHHMVGETHDMEAITNGLRDHIADFEDFWRPIRSYFYWEKHCYDIPICWSLRAIFDSIDGVDELSDKLHDLVLDLDQIDVLMPQLLTQFPPMIATMQSTRTMMLAMHSTMAGIFDQLDDEAGSSPTAMGKAFDTAKDDDSFYLPPEAFTDPDFKRIMKAFVSPDGRAVRLFIWQRDDPTSPDGIWRVNAIKTAAEEALKATPLEDAKLYLAGSAAMAKDLADGSKYDLMIAGVAALSLIFIIMLAVTRSFIAAVVIVGTVVLSLGASFGLSVLAWQYLLGLPLHWTVLSASVIILLAVGSAYNLLLVYRMKEEIGAGINTGIIRAMGGTGNVVTNAGLVFALAMAATAVSDLRSISQIGTTIGIGVLFDTLVVRGFMTPSIAALLGRWFWWPQRVRSRPASALLEPPRPRPLVRALLVRQQR